MRSVGRKRGRALWLLPVVVGLTASALTFAHPEGVKAYSHSGAASWADAHWNVCGVSQRYLCISNDCTAFVSESMNAGGGWAMDTNGTIPKGSSSDDTKWYMIYQPATNSYVWSNSFTFAQNLRNFVLADVPGGLSRGTRAGTSLDLDSGVGTGDIIFYDWDPSSPDGGSEPYDHVNIVTGLGTGSDGYYGDYVDGHSNYRYHIFWTTRTYNAHIQTTVINPVDIDGAN